MRIIFEYNDDEKHLIKWCLFKCASLIGTGTDEKLEYKNKVVISNVFEIPIKFQEFFKKDEK